MHGLRAIDAHVEKASDRRLPDLLGTNRIQPRQSLQAVLL
jgi:hypothetical protein